MDLNQLKRTLEALQEKAEAQSPIAPPVLLTQAVERLQTPRAGNTMIVNYLSLIVFVILMIFGWNTVGDRFRMDPPQLMLPIVWFIGSWIASGAIKLAAQWERALVFTLGRYSRTKGPGVYLVIPLIEQVRHVDTRVVTVDIPRQEAITKDNVPVALDGVVFLRVVRPDQAVINVQDYMFAIVQYARSALRDVIGGRTLDEILTEREALGHQIEQMLIKETEHWGLEVDGIRIQDIILPEDLKKVMSRQASAEREKRANITKSEGDKLAAQNLADAAGTMMASPGAMQLRTLQTIDGLGPTASNTVVLAIPIEVMEAVEAIGKLKPSLPS